MFNKLFSSVSGLNSFTSIVTWIQSLIAHLITDIQDPNLKNEAIDAIIQILQAHKNVAPVQPVAPVVPIQPPQA